MKVGYHASHEQFSPSELLHYVKLAHAAGFQGAMCSDHFAPWGRSQGQSGFAWSWLGAALEAVDFDIGVVTTPIGLRYHPAIIAQAGATLGDMYPGRFWMALGSGEAMNECFAGQRWPAKAERNDRLIEAVEIMRALYDGQTVTRSGLISTEQATLYTRPPIIPRLVGAALTPATARLAGGWADGMVTINQPRNKLSSLISAFREGGGTGKPIILQVHLSYAPTDEEARQNAYDQWRTNALSSSVAADLRFPEQFDDATRYVRPTDLDDSIRISSDIGQQLSWLMEDKEMGFDEVYLHNVGRNQEYFIRQFCEVILRSFL